MRSRPLRQRGLFSVPVDEETRSVLLPFAEREGEFSFALPQAAIEAYESFTLPGQAMRGELGAPGSPEMVQGATRFGVDYGMLPALATGLLTPSPNTLRMGMGGDSAAKTVETDPMVVMHNIHEEPLQAAYERGGIPVPSLAIVRADEPLTKFGEVSLIGSPDMARPSPKNPVYKTDAYTVRQPRTEILPNQKAERFSAENFTSPLRQVRYIDPRDVAEDLLEKNLDGAGKIALQAAFLKERGKLPSLESFDDPYDFNKFVRSAVMEEYGYNNWFLEQSNKLKDFGGGGDERFFLGFSPSGKRKYKSATLDNLVRAMKGKGAGSEGMFETPSSFRGKIAEKFKTQKEIEQSRGRLGKEENFEELQAEVSEMYYDLINRISRQTNLEGRGAEDVLEYVIIGGNKQLRDFAQEYMGEISDLVVDDAKIFAQMVRDLPTEYFEIKPQRGVSLSEFKGAIVPSNVQEETIRALQESGIENIKKYDTQEERAKLVKKFGDEFFTVPAVPTGAGGLLGDDRRVETVEDFYRAGIL